MSNLEMHEKIKSIRNAEDLGRGVFSQRTKIPKRTLEAIENRGTDPRSSFIKGVCNAFPEYSLWIMTNEINLNAGQISPDVKKIWNQEQDRFFSISEGLISFDRFNVNHIYLVKKMVKDFKSLITDAIDITYKLEEEEYAKAIRENQIIHDSEQTFHFYSPEEIKLIDPSYNSNKLLDLKGLFMEVLKNTKAKDLTYDTLLKLIKKRTKE